MVRVRRTVGASVLTLMLASRAIAQSASSRTSTVPFTPAATTFQGDTGLWFAPTAEVLAPGKWSASGYRRGTNFIQGFANIGDFAGTLALGDTAAQPKGGAGRQPQLIGQTGHGMWFYA
jgi:hypothetical protein